MSLLKGTVRGYDAGAGTAEVEIVGSHGQWVTVPVATDLDSKTVVAGKKCAVLSFDDRDSGDAVLVATYDDLFLMGSAPLDDHDHTGDAGDGGQLEADLALLATGDAATKVLTPDGANAVQWADVPVHATRHQNAGADEISVAGLSGLLADGQTPVDHDHTGDAGDGGQLEADEALVATSITDGYVLTADGANGLAWEALPAGGGYTFTPGKYTSTSWDGDAHNGNETIDLSATFGVPAGVKAVVVRLAYEDETPQVSVMISKDSGDIGNGMSLINQVANYWVATVGIVPCDASGDIYWWQNGEIDSVSLTILGYWS